MSNPAIRRVWTQPHVLGVLVPLVLAVAAYCRHLWPEWSHNPDLSHGLFTPLVFLLLVAESRTHGTQRWLADGPASRWLVTLAGAAVILLIGMAGLLAASLGWSHSLVDFILAAALAGALLAGLICLADPTVRLVPLNWISLTAAGLWILSAPLPTGTYSRLTLHLQEMVTGGVLHSLHFLGIPARQFGNLIQMAGTTVGVEEACSGIRSLLSCVYAGFFFAAWQVRSPAGRALLILTAPVLAIIMNFIRSLGLTLMANAGMTITGFWHDATGFAILGLTAGIMALLALGLSPRNESPTGATPTPPAGPHPIFARRLFGVTSLGVASLAVFFAYYGHSTTPRAEDHRDVAALLPSVAAGWEIRTARDLYQFSDILRTSQLAERSYLRVIDGSPVILTVYLAHWSPGQAPVSLVASHTPDACWPGAGWTSVADNTPRAGLPLDGKVLPAAEHRVFQYGSASHAQHVWFWHVYDGRVISHRDPYSVPALLKLALQYGFRREGDQYFVRISSNAPWEVLAREPLVRELFANLAPTGLAP